MVGYCEFVVYLILHWISILIFSSCPQVKRASKCSKWDWNWQNKASLLMAEKYSLAKSNDEAEAEYDAAISGAQSSGFIHEEALGTSILFSLLST
jgi:hypothetical protein